MKFLLLVFTLFSHTTFAHFPENSLSYPVGAKSLRGISESEFHQVIDKVMRIYAPKIEALGGTLNISRSWANDKVNASTNRFAHVYQVNMFGGMARHPMMTRDGFTLVLCHEIGHHLGGAPKVKNTDQRWASNEGQADYWATLKCLREVFWDENNAEIVKGFQIPQVVRKGCADVYQTELETLICERSNMAGLAVGKLYASLVDQNSPQFETPSSKIVRETSDHHPHFQCRLDTFFQGALCDRPLDEELSNREASVGTCHPINGDKIGMRPSCWFRTE